MLTLTEYYMNHDIEYPVELNDNKRADAQITIARANALMALAIADGVQFNINPKTGSVITSGWRPQVINDQIPNAAHFSNHIVCRAVDVFDPDGAIDDWCLANSDEGGKLEQVGLWLEHPAATKGWSHWQIVRPRSGNRVFYP